MIIDCKAPSLPEHSGGSVSYYKIKITNPTHSEWQPVSYNAECNDYIRALRMNFAVGNIFKATWRLAAAGIGLKKPGYDDGIYDLEKIIEFATDELNYLKALKLQKKEYLTAEESLAIVSSPVQQKALYCHLYPSCKCITGCPSKPVGK
jgi:hypothetical protein